MSHTTWEAYLARLCLDTWVLDPKATVQIIKQIEALVGPGAVSESTVATVLRRAGVAETVAGFTAPSICRVIAA
ncbi:MAG TPA: hypothetical protein ENO23_01765 [Alphaproteobacteria bacterium]|nr:hypothetical protein [Alphaproteobacteria bacterium]